MNWPTAAIWIALILGLFGLIGFLAYVAMVYEHKKDGS